MWNDPETENLGRKDLFKWLARLKEKLGSVEVVQDYIKWAKNEKVPKRAALSLDPAEVANDLENADWIRGNSNLCNLQSRLTQSTRPSSWTHHARPELNATYQGYNIGLQIHGRPIVYRPAWQEDFEDLGIGANSDVVLAVGYQPHINPSVKSKLKRETMLFAPLGKWTSLVLILNNNLTHVNKGIYLLNSHLRLDELTPDWC